MRGNGHVSQENCGCVSESVRYAQVSVAVDMRPYAKLGQPRTECCGIPDISCTGTEHGCRIMITQSLCVSIPVKYGVCVSGEQTQVHCSDCR